LGYTVKPNVYGSLAAHFLGIPVINNIAGLGATFIRPNWLTYVVCFLYRISLTRSRKVFFQNQDDREMFARKGLVKQEQTDCLPGSGVDLAKFAPSTSSDAPDASSKFQFLLIARMLWDKGVWEFVEAARLLRSRYPEAEFCLLGFLDAENPAAISRSQMDLWVKEGVINYLGVSDDVRAQIKVADCIVLPSYREGTPRSLLEAAAMARPIVTTNAVGCREAVDDEHNGFLCRPKDALDLSLKMERMLQLSCDERKAMGRYGREKMELQFDEKFVIAKYLDAIEEILPPGSS
jgi:glycosyltransferase involved in cell wall biosynthesis